MKSLSLRATTAVALFLGATAVYAQMPQKEQGPEATPGDKSQVQERKRAPSTDGKTSVDKGEPKGKASQGASQGSGQGAGEGARKTEPQDKATKGTAEKDITPKEKSTKGSAQKSEGTPSRDKAASEKAGTADQKAGKAGAGPRAQLSEQQQVRVRETVLKQKGERVTNVNFSVSVGTRVPRSFRLVALPAAVIEIVPEYRSYHYLVVRDDIVIVDPNTYEIVYIIAGSKTTAGGGAPSGLSLSSEQLAFILRNIDLKSESRLGIGGLAVGATVARDVELREFPSLVVEKLPELRSYRFLVHENDIAFVEPRELKIVLVTETRR